MVLSSNFITSLNVVQERLVRIEYTINYYREPYIKIGLALLTPGCEKH